GFRPNGAICKECSFGTYKALIENVACTVCPVHSTCTEVGKTDLTCDKGYTAENNDCICDEGFRLDSINYEECSFGTYKALSGNVT
ncbi:MAG: receptor, partial [Paramarteilia canceri]